MATYKCRISIMIGSNSTGNLVDCITIQNEILLEGKRGVMCQKNAGLGQGMMGVTCGNTTPCPPNTPLCKSQNKKKRRSDHSEGTHG